MKFLICSYLGLAEKVPRVGFRKITSFLRRQESALANDFVIIETKNISLRVSIFIIYYAILTYSCAGMTCFFINLCRYSHQQTIVVYCFTRCIN